MSADSQDIVIFLGDQWGTYLREGELDVSTPCTLAAAIEIERTGLAGHGQQRNGHVIPLLELPDPPIKGMPFAALTFHRAWRTLVEAHRVLLWVRFVVRDSAGNKARALGLLRDEYDEALGRSISAVRKRMLDA